MDGAVSFLITMNRQGFYDFTKPYAMAGTPKSLVALADSGIDINNLDGKVIGMYKCCPIVLLVTNISYEMSWKISVKNVGLSSKNFITQTELVSSLINGTYETSNLRVK